MTATLTPGEQSRRFVKAHPGEWQEAPTDNPDEMTFVLEVYPYRIKVEAYLSAVWGSLEHFNYDDTPSLDPCPVGASLLTQIAWQGADVLQAHGGSPDDLPPWLADPVRQILRTRAGELLTLAGSSPADVLSAAETVDEALCGRPVVEVTSVLRALMSVGMSCRWATGADEAADDYVGFVSRRLDVVAEERDGLRAAIVQALADLDAYSEIDKGVRIATLPARANLRRVLGVT